MQPNRSMTNYKAIKGRKLDMWKYESAEMKRLDIPHGDVLEVRLLTYWSHLVFLGDLE